MTQITEKIEEVLREAFDKCGYPDADVSVKISDRPDLCEYQCNSALPAAKKYSVNPMDIASEVAGSAKDEIIFDKIEATRPGFINIILSPVFLSEHLKKLSCETKLWVDGEKTP